MTQAAVDQSGTDARSIVTGFYRALAGGDVEGVAKLVEDNFADDAVLARPESLPGGGRTEGARRIVRFAKGAAGAGMPISVSNVFDASSDSTSRFFVDLTIDMGTGPIRAIEWWTFGGDKVTSLEAFYWDTAAILAPAGD